MPTPMNAYARIAKRFGINDQDIQAVDDFFSIKVPQMAQSVQKAILHELLMCDGMTEEEITHEQIIQDLVTDLSKDFEHLFNEDGNLKGTPPKSPKSPNATNTININFREQELEAQIEEQRKELFRLKEHNRIARTELTRIKDGIKRCESTMIIDGNDMCDWGWMTTSDVNKTCRTRWGYGINEHPHENPYL